MALTIRAESTCRFDAVALGEVMLRLDPGETRIATARSFQVWEGGGEYNVARGLRRTFRLRTAVVTSLVDNEVGRLIEGLVLAGGVDAGLIRWVPFDGAGRRSRNGLNFTERGFGVRGAVGVSDRGNTAVGQLKPGDVDWDHLFGSVGVRWFHTGGIFASLSQSTAAVAVEAMTSARRHGVVVSYDLNFRPSLWQDIGGARRAQEVNRELAGLVDVMIGNEEDFTSALGFGVTGADPGYAELVTDSYRAMLAQATRSYPNWHLVATTLRSVHSASRNGWAAVAWSRDDGFVESVHRELEVLDRVGGGDSFASGLIYGILNGRSLGDAVEYGAAHGALAMTTPGDTSMATLADVDHLIAGGGARVRR